MCMGKRKKIMVKTHTHKKTEEKPQHKTQILRIC